MKRKILEMNWMEFKETVPKKIDKVLLPTGTMEAHSIIPLGTDILIPEKISEMIVNSLNMLIAPTINYGITKSLLPYPGSMTVSRRSFLDYTYESCAGLADNGFKQIFIINGHGGQTDELRTIVRKLWDDKRIFSAVISWWMLCEDIVQEVYGESGGHGGLDETAAILAIDEKLVQKKRLKKIKGGIFRSGVVAHPLPSSLILYKEGEGMPVFEKEKAITFLSKVADRVKKAIREIMTGWDSIQ